MRISDWSSDVCSSDLQAIIRGHQPRDHAMFAVMPNGANDRWSDDLAHRATSARGQRLSMKIVIDDLRHRLGKGRFGIPRQGRGRSEEHTSELQSLMRISYAVFCLNKKNK